ncbi:MAG TPA: hypothetical protein VM346_09060 [Sphingomicrobium sp.]|nr:hypothetical protein [Sphingomicrobium sp.]
MKYAILSAAAAAIVAIPATSASAGTLTLGGPLAVNCYEAALARYVSQPSMEACNRSLAEEPLNRRDRAATLVNRGILRMLGNQHGAADADFDSAIRLDSSAADPWLNKAFLRLKQGDASGALPLIDAAISRQARRQALALFARGLAHEQTGNYGAAYSDLMRARDLEPGWDMPAKALARYELRGR